MKILTNSVVQPVLALGLVAAIALTPLVGFAKNDSNKDKNEDRSAVSATNQVSVDINNGGRTSVTGAKVTSVSSDTVVANAQWGSANVTFNVKVSSSTSIKDAKGKNTMPIGNIVVGDTVNFSGSLNTGASGLTVNATQIKDVTRNSTETPKPQSHVFQGKLQSLGSNSLGLMIDSINYTVNVPSNALILAKNWTATNLSSFVVGDTVRVFGSIQTSTSTVIDALVVRNASR
ncbi:MAG: hypothetical protein KBD50_02065 [Candidatus Pacebacteria bacterium]|nr:hypothetical protein [Candidatus Paceibacterota bacterium]